MYIMMDRRLYKIIERTLGHEYFEQYPNDQPTRVIVQKALYLLTHGKESPKLTLPYGWCFYLLGPYSSDIAHMIYYINEMKDLLFNKPTNIEEQDLDPIVHFVDFKADLFLSKENNDELQSIPNDVIFQVASIIVYAALQIGSGFKSLMDKIIQFVPATKGWTSKETVVPIYNNLANYHYI